MTTVLGLDVSSFQLDGALLTPGQAPILRRELLGTPKDPLIERLRQVRGAITRLAYWQVEAIHVCQAYIVHSPDWIVIEEPAGYGQRALMPVLGAITAAVPRECQVAWRKASEWRHDLSAKNTKADGHRVVGRILWKEYWRQEIIDTLDEHEFDAIGIALAYQKLLAHPDNAHLGAA